MSFFCNKNDDQKKGFEKFKKKEKQPTQKVDKPNDKKET
jgi:hypothetical protein